MPSFYAEIADEAKVGLSREIRGFLDGPAPVTCDICRSRWFSANSTPPGWAGKGSKPPEALWELRTPKDPDEDGPLLFLEREEDKFKFTATNYMYIGPSFPDLDAPYGCGADVRFPRSPAGPELLCTYGPGSLHRPRRKFGAES